MRKKLAYFLSCTAIIVCLAGCGGGVAAGGAKTLNDLGAGAPAVEAMPAAEESDWSYEDTYDNSADSSEDAVASDDVSMDGSEERVSDYSTVTFDADRKLIYHADVVLETLNYEKTYDELLKILSKYDGYIQSESYQNDNGSYLNKDYEHEGLIVYSHNNICVRVPRKNYFDFMEDGLSLGNIVNKSQSVDDKTAEYGTNQSHIDILNKELDYYNAQLDKLDEELTKAIEEDNGAKFDYILNEMQNMSAAKVDVEKELIPYKRHNSDIDAESSYATINMDIREVKEYTKPVVEPERELTFGERVNEAFERSWKRFITWVEAIIILLIELIPIILILAIPAGIILLIVWFFRKVFKSKKLDKKPDKKLPKLPARKPAKKPDEKKSLAETIDNDISEDFQSKSADDISDDFQSRLADDIEGISGKDPSEIMPDISLSNMNYTNED